MDAATTTKSPPYMIAEIFHEKIERAEKVGVLVISLLQE
jgi:hypothetical protein